MYDAPGQRVEVIFPGLGAEKLGAIDSSSFAFVDNKVLYLVKTGQPTRWDRPDSSAVTQIQPGERCVGALGGVHEVACEGALASLAVGQKVWINATDRETLLLAAGGGTGGSDANEKTSFKVEGSGGTWRIITAFGTTAKLKFDATTKEVREALEALDGISPGDVVVTGGPGSVGGGTPYVVEWTGQFEKTDVVAPTADDELTGGEEKVTVTTSTAGAGSTDVSVPVGVVDEIDASRTPHVARINANALHAFIQG